MAVFLGLPKTYRVKVKYAIYIVYLWCLLIHSRVFIFEHSVCHSGKILSGNNLTIFYFAFHKCHSLKRLIKTTCLNVNISSMLITLNFVFSGQIVNPAASGVQHPWPLLSTEWRRGGEFSPLFVQTESSACHFGCHSAWYLKCQHY